MTLHTLWIIRKCPLRVKLDWLTSREIESYDGLTHYGQRLFRPLTGDISRKNMTQELRYGLDGTLRLEVPQDAVTADFSTVRGQPLDDTVAAVAAALCDPLDFPPLSQATIPGDCIALVLEPGLPQAAEVVAGVVHSLLEGEAQPGDITIVQTAQEAQSDNCDPRSLLSAEVAEAVQLVQHDATDRETLSYLATSKENKPIYINRTIHDADVVIPLGMLRLDASLGYMGVHGGLFPAFSDADTQKRFQAIGSADQDVQQNRRRSEAEEAAWLLGVLFTVQVIPGSGDSILHVLAGDANSVASRGQAICRDAWQFSVPHRAGLVVATIEGGPQQQTWENFARALFAASRVVRDEGAIVLCTALACRPGPSLQRLLATDDVEAVLREIRRDRTDDALPASLLIEARRRTRVYLLSELDGEVVEDLGVGYVAQDDEIQRLAQQHDSCILLANAHRALPAPQDE